MVAFLNQEVDVVVFASAPESLLVQMLLQSPGVGLMDFAQSEAYARRFGFLTPVVLPQGVVDLAKNQPPSDVRLVAPTSTLLASGNTHRAIRNGQPWLQRYWPFWLANVVERMWLAGGLILALVLPLSRILPPLYTLRVRSKVFRWYAELQEIEERVERSTSTQDTQAQLLALDRLEVTVEHVQGPCPTPTSSTLCAATSAGCASGSCNTCRHIDGSTVGRGCRRGLQALGQPHFDDRLTCDAQLAGLSIQRVDHPCGEVHIHPLLRLQ